MLKGLKGLSASEASASREKNGSNELLKIKKKGFFGRLFENLSDPIIRILLIALALQVLFTFGNCNLIEVLGIVMAIMIATVVSTLSEMGSERAFMRLEAEGLEGRVRALRAGGVCTLAVSDVVVGDILLVSRGEKIAADGTLIRGEVSVDQSALYGENTEVEKRRGSLGGELELGNEGKLFRGSIVTEGEGVMQVERVGDATFYGMVARDVQSETRESPLKLRLSRLAGQISVLGYIIAALVGISFLFNSFVVGLDFDIVRIKAAFSDVPFVLTTLVRALTLMITVVVVAVPEGLPMMITVVLSANMKRMLRDKILVKKLVGIETAGSLNILFSDKTGTITTGRLSVNEIITEEGSYRAIGALSRAGAVERALTLSAAYNTDCLVSGGEVVGGNATDRAISRFFSDVSYEKMTVTERLPFSSENKCSSVTLSGGTRLVKGAPEVLLSECKYYLSQDGSHIASELRSVRRRMNEALARGERAIAVAIEERGGSLVFVALITLKDKIREGVKEAVRAVKSAGIQIVMVTGDNKDTAVSIAEECGFYRAGAGHIALSSSELNELSDERVKEILPRLRVVARALPQDKTRLVRLSQELELVVGMTGDGINDAPSLKLADVGFAMGSGTDIAKSAGDIVILDNSFGAISKTILYGRTIFKSIRKFITFQLIMNLAACGITLIGQLFGIENPITIIQMLWVNIIMDTLGALAFAGEAPVDYYMKERPKRRDEPIINREIISHIIANGAFTLLILVLFLRLDVFDTLFAGERARMGAFYALFIFAGLMNCLGARCERLFIFRGILKNRPFLLIMSFISVIQVLIIYFGGELFRSYPLSPPQFITVIGISVSVLIFDVLRRIWNKLSA